MVTGVVVVVELPDPAPVVGAAQSAALLRGRGGGLGLQVEALVPGEVGRERGGAWAAPGGRRRTVDIRTEQEQRHRGQPHEEGDLEGDHDPVTKRHVQSTA